MVLGLDILDSSENALMFVILQHFANAFIDCTLDSYVLQEARRDLINGQKDMVLFNTFGLGIGAIVGCAFGGYFQAYHTCFHSYIFCAIFALIGLIGSFYLPIELETNDLAQSVPHTTV